MSDAPETVGFHELPFEPTHPWVYWCGDCERHIDPTEVRQHLEQMKAEGGHGPVVNLTRVDVVR